MVLCRSSRWIVFGLANLVALGTGSACSDGCGGIGSFFGATSPPPGSARALVGDYRLASLDEGRDGCNTTESVPTGGRVVRIRRTSSGEARDGGEGGQSAAPELRVRVCRTERCSDPDWQVDLRKTEDGGWEEHRGSGSVLEGPPAARRCRLRWVRWRLTPSNGNVQLERVVRARNLVLEGAQRCGETLALEYDTELNCHRRLKMRATPDEELSG